MVDFLVIVSVVGVCWSDGWGIFFGVLRSMLVLWGVVDRDCVYIFGVFIVIIVVFKMIVIFGCLCVDYFFFIMILL